MDRRKFIKTAGLSSIGMVVAGLTASCSNIAKKGGLTVESSPDFSDHNLYPFYDGNKYVEKDFSHLLNVDHLGLSPGLLENHLKLYSNYIKKVNEAEASMAKGDVDEFSLKNLAFSLNGMALHDIYFSNMVSKPHPDHVKIPKHLKVAIENTYGNFGHYLQNLKEIAMRESGWCITGCKFT